MCVPRKITEFASEDAADYFDQSTMDPMSLNITYSNLPALLKLHADYLYFIFHDDDAHAVLDMEQKKIFRTAIEVVLNMQNIPLEDKMYFMEAKIEECVAACVLHGLNDEVSFVQLIEELKEYKKKVIEAAKTILYLNHVDVVHKEDIDDEIDKILEELSREIPDAAVISVMDLTVDDDAATAETSAEIIQKLKNKYKKKYMLQKKSMRQVVRRRRIRYGGVNSKKSTKAVAHKKTNKYA